LFEKTQSSANKKAKRRTNHLFALLVLNEVYLKK